MKHFIGGWALGALLTLISIGDYKKNWIEHLLWASLVIGPLCGLAVWGLM